MKNEKGGKYVNISEAAGLMGAGVEHVSAELFDNEITDFSVDSRSVGAGELFFAIAPEDYARAGFNGVFVDSHQFVPEAFAKGAVAAVAVSDRIHDEKLRPFFDRLLLVNDGIAALQLLARRVYESWDQPVVGITGSAGKTTAKELTAHLLSSSGRRVLKSERNYNNGLGLPLSVLKMVSSGHAPDHFDVAVLEMGMSSPTHEIRRLCQITPPDVGVELMVAPVHLEFLGTIENVAAAKAELIEGLKPGGTAVLNADDEWVIGMRDKHRGPVVTFGIDNDADVTATDIDSSRLGIIRFRLKTPRGDVSAALPMSGRHNLMNALAAAAVANCLEIPPEDIADGLRTATAPRMRGEVLDFAAGFTVVDDSYNSNPRSLISMVRIITEAGRTRRRRIVIAGEMLELGEDASELHREAGREIALAEMDVLWGVRGLAKDMLLGAVEGGIPATRFFESSDEAAKAIVDEVREGDLILVKGSRGVATDKVVKALRERFPMVGTDEREGDVD